MLYGYAHSLAQPRHKVAKFGEHDIWKGGVSDPGSKLAPGKRLGVFSAVRKSDVCAKSCNVFMADDAVGSCK